MVIIGGGGALSADIDDGLARLVDRVLSRADRMIIEEVKTRAETVYLAAVREWPVGRPRTDQPYPSRSRLSWTLEVGDGVVSGHVRNDAPWARYIKAKKLWYKSAMVELLRKPLHKAGRGLARELPGLIAALGED